MHLQQVQTQQQQPQQQQRKVMTMITIAAKINIATKKYHHSALHSTQITTNSRSDVRNLINWLHKLSKITSENSKEVSGTSKIAYLLFCQPRTRTFQL